MNKIKQHELVDFKEIDKNTNYCANLVDFYEKDIVYGKKCMMYADERLTSNVDIKFKNKNKNKNQKLIQEAPKSIMEKHELTKYKQHKDFLRAINRNNFEINIPTNLQLKGIADDFSTQYNFNEEYPIQKFDNNERYINSTNIESDDINDDILSPLDFVKQFNVTISSFNFIDSFRFK